MDDHNDNYNCDSPYMCTNFVAFEEEKKKDCNPGGNYCVRTHSSSSQILCVSSVCRRPCVRVLIHQRGLGLGTHVLLYRHVDLGVWMCGCGQQICTVVQITSCDQCSIPKERGK
jgi:hypothetical protein